MRTREMKSFNLLLDTPSARFQDLLVPFSLADIHLNADTTIKEFLTQ
jgi:hypothetical protein